MGPVSRKAQLYVTLLGRLAITVRSSPVAGVPLGVRPPVHSGRFFPVPQRNMVKPPLYGGGDRCRDPESSVDDFFFGQGAVLGRAVVTLRSVETRPLPTGIRLGLP